VAAFLGTRPGGEAFIAEQGNIAFCPNLVLGSRRLRESCTQRVSRELGHHLIGPNTSGSVRKAYVVQLAPDAVVAFRNGDVPEPQDDPDRQFPIRERGRPLAASG
jgi:hypothetical protein